MIFVCAGHHPAKQGECWGWFHEYPEAAAWANCLAHHLGDMATRVHDGILRRKVAYIERHCVEGDVAVEFHFRAAVRGRGAEVRFLPSDAEGEALARRLSAAMPAHDPAWGARPGWYHDEPDNGPDFFLTALPIPTVLIVPDSVAEVHRVRESLESTCRDLALTLVSR